MRRMVILVTSATLLAGCSRSPRTGDLLECQGVGSVVFYSDPELFKAAVELTDANAKSEASDKILTAFGVAEGRWTIVYLGSRLRVLKPEHGGAKVVIEVGTDWRDESDHAASTSSENSQYRPVRSLTGKIGWVEINSLTSPNLKVVDH